MQCGLISGIKICSAALVKFQHHNITSDNLSDQNNEIFYYVKQTVENRRPSKMGDVATLLL
jgi:sialic acid synthase SpsE